MCFYILALLKELVIQKNQRRKKSEKVTLKKKMKTTKRNRKKVYSGKLIPLTKLSSKFSLKMKK